MKIQCDKCGKTNDIPNEYSGQKVKCLACGETIEVPIIDIPKGPIKAINPVKEPNLPDCMGLKIIGWASCIFSIYYFFMPDQEPLYKLICPITFLLSVIIIGLTAIVDAITWQERRRRRILRGQKDTD